MFWLCHEFETAVSDHALGGDSSGTAAHSLFHHSIFHLKPAELFQQRLTEQENCNAAGNAVGDIVGQSAGEHSQGIGRGDSCSCGENGAAVEQGANK